MTMNRPKYETESDREAENAIADRFAEEYAGTQLEFPEFSRIDRLFTRRGKPRAWLEIKRRNHECGRYNTYALSAKKYQSMVRLAKITNVPSILVVGFTDLIAWVNLDELGALSMWQGGRDDRDDPQDEEYMVHIPIARFKFIMDD